MIHSSFLTSQNLSGLFELNAAGEILYSRFRELNELIDGGPEWIGHNYFDEVAAFTNVEEFRRVYNRFVNSRQSVDCFTFDCWFAERLVPVRVMMARTYKKQNERGDGNGEDGIIVLMDIRQMEEFH